MSSPMDTVTEADMAIAMAVSILLVSFGGVLNGITCPAPRGNWGHPPQPDGRGAGGDGPCREASREWVHFGSRLPHP